MFAQEKERMVSPVTQVQYMKNAIIETISETTDEEVIRYIYTVLMTISSVTSLELQQADS